MTQISARPIEFIPRAPARCIVLLFHGLTGSPNELLTTAEALLGVGCHVVAPILPGHGEHVSQLAAVASGDWSSYAEGEFERAAKFRLPIIVGGLSLGALLALNLAARPKHDIAGLMMFAPPVFFRRSQERYQLPVAAMLPPYFRSRLGFREKRRRPMGYLALPHHAFTSHSMSAVAELERLRRYALSDLAKVCCRTLIVQDPFDHHLQPYSSEHLQDLLNRAPSRVVLLPGGEHELPLGHMHQELSAHVAKFVSELL